MLVVNVIDPELVVLTPQLRNADFNHFQPVLVFVYGVHKNIAGCGLLVCISKIEETKKI